MLFQTKGSSLCLVYGLENFVDVLSSTIVLWRFFAPSSMTAELERKLAGREQRASILISFILVVLGIVVIVAGAMHLQRGEEEVQSLRLVIALSFFSIIIFGVLAVLKFRYSVRLSSPSLYKDGVCSLIGTILAIALFVNSLIIQSAPEAWWIDPLVAICAGSAAIVYGLSGVCLGYYRDKLPLCSCRWWFASHGSSSPAKEIEAPDVSGGANHRPSPEHFSAGPTEEMEEEEDMGETI